MIEKLFRLTWKKGCLIIVAFMVMFVAHNFLSYAVGKDEGISLIITVIGIPAYLVICIVYSAIKRR
jgi:hypothetical protein